MRGLRKLTALFAKIPKNSARNSDLNATAAENLTLVKEKSPSKYFDGSKEMMDPPSTTSVLSSDGAKQTDSFCSYFHDQNSGIPWGGIKPATVLGYMERRRFTARERKQKVVYKNTMGKVVIKDCIKSAKKSFGEDECLRNIYKADHVFKRMKENGVQIQETTYGPLLSYLVETGMVEEFEYFSQVITEANPGAFYRVGYYEMLLWIKVGNEHKIQELCNSVGVDNVEGELTEGYLLALCESDSDRYEKELVKLLSVIDVPKVSSQDYLSSVFKALGKHKLKIFAQKFILALKASGTAEEKLSHFIYSYTTSIPALAVDDAISECEKLHEKFHVPPSFLSNGDFFNKELQKMLSKASKAPTLWAPCLTNIPQVDAVVPCSFQGS